MPSRDLLLICANLLPIGTYLCVLGLLHAVGRPLVTTGVRDFFALAIALAALAINGPINYILHSRMLPDFLVHSHWIGLMLYIVLVAALTPRGNETLIVYNCQESLVMAAVRSILEREGLSFQEVPGGWILASRGVSVEVDTFSPLSNVTLRFRGMRDRTLFRQVQNELPELLAANRTGWSLLGLFLAATGGLVLAFPVWMLARDPRNIATLVREVIQTW